jgi:hypothetical protein
VREVSSQLCAAPFDACVCINMLHISAWEITEALFAGLSSSSMLREGAPVCVYGPFARDGALVASNSQFDLWLRAQNSAWGVRDLSDVSVVAQRCGFDLEDVHEMPANNLFVVFRKRSA